MLLKDLGREVISGSRFLSYRKSSGGIDYCIKLPRPEFRKKLIDRSHAETIVTKLNLIGRDPFALLPPMWAMVHDAFGIVLIMPWGESAPTPGSVTNTLDYLKEKYRIEFFDLIQCHSWRGEAFISDWSDICFPK